MRNLISYLPAISICLLMSCSRQEEPPKEEKIHIIVQHEASGGRDRPAAKPSSPRSDTDRTETEQPDSLRPAQTPAVPKSPGPEVPPGPDELLFEKKITKLRDTLDIMHKMIKDDDQLRKLVVQGKPLPLTDYILEHHETEIDKIAERSEVKNKRYIALLLSRMMIKGQRTRKKRAVK